MKNIINDTNNYINLKLCPLISYEYPIYKIAIGQNPELAILIKCDQ